MKKIAEWGNFEYTGPDVVRSCMLENETDHSDDRAVWVALRSQVTEAIAHNKTIVIDSTFHTKERRAHFISFVRDHGDVRIKGLFFDIPLAIILSRKEQRLADGGKDVSAEYIRQAFTELQENRPAVDEGFDSLFKITADGSVFPGETTVDSILAHYFD